MLETLTKTLSTNVRRLRTAKGLTQSRLAELAAIKLRTFQNIEQGDTWPEQHNLEMIAKALAIQPFELFRTAEFKASPEEALEVLAGVVRERNAQPYGFPHTLSALQSDPRLRAIIDAFPALDDTQVKAILSVACPSLTGNEEQMDGPKKGQGAS